MYYSYSSILSLTSALVVNATTPVPILEPPNVQPVASRYTDYASQAPPVS